MRLLLLGGTVFLGPALVAAARAHGHRVTVFHRGRHAAPPDLGADVEVATGDRNRADDLAALAARGPWDAAIDTCGYFPRQVRDAAAALRGRVGRYAFVSSISVLADPCGAADEDAAAVAPAGDDVASITGETYGPLKVACEVAAREAFGAAALVLRPGLIVGPGDPSDRYAYWVRRIARGGTVLAPGDGARLVQFVDVADLAEFAVGRVADGTGGTFHVDGAPLRFDAFLAGIAAAAGLAPDLRWVPEETLLARGVRPWLDLPLWIAGEDQRAGISRALAAGLRLRDPVETARRTLAWDRTRDPARPLAAGIPAEREAELLAAP